MGTAAYMSPEQARGKFVDRRADVWAFGCVLYQMLTGRRIFEGETATDVIAAIVTREPDWGALPAATPPSVRHLLRRCLEKKPRERLRDIGEARIALRRAAEEPAAVDDSARPAATARRGVSWLVLVAAVIAGVLITAWIMRKTAAPGARSPVHLSLIPEDDAPYVLGLGGLTAIALSPDGSTLAYPMRMPDVSRRLALVELDGSGDHGARRQRLAVAPVLFA